MYIPRHFEEKRTDALHRLVRDNAFGVLVTFGVDGIDANHVPFELDPNEGEFGTLRCHVARSNPVWRTASSDVDSLAIFEGPSAYVSPSWYPSKQEDGRVVPTYNYMVAHAYGKMRIIDDPQWLRGLVTRLTEGYEQGQAAPWQVTDAPDEYVEKLLKAIVGIELPIARMSGKWKLSQNRSLEDREGVSANLKEKGDEQSMLMASHMANLMGDTA